MKHLLIININEYGGDVGIANAILTTTDKTAVGKLESEKRY